MQQREWKRYLPIAVIVLVALVVLVWVIFFPPPERDEDGCPTTGVQNHTVVILDRTDPFGERTAGAIRSAIQKVIAAVPAGAKVSIYEIDFSNMNGLSKPVFSRCRPRDGSHASKLTENPTMLAGSYKKKFGQPLEKVLEKYKGGDEQPHSPIMECLVDVQSIPDFGPDVQDRRLIIVSDMLQHTNILSHYAGRADFAAAMKSNVFRQMVPDLRGIRIGIYYILREGKVLALQDNRHVEFWLEFFQAANGTVEFIEKIR